MDQITAVAARRLAQDGKLVMTKVVGGFIATHNMNQDFSFFASRVLFIGAHPDDIELGCGALIAHICPIGRSDVRDALG